MDGFCLTTAMIANTGVWWPEGGNTLLVHHPLFVTQHSAHCCSAACGRSVLHTECRTFQRAQSKAVQSYVIFACSVPKKEPSNCQSHISAYRCLDDVIHVRYMSNVGLDTAFSGSHAELSAKQRAFFLHPLSHEPLLLGQSLLCVPTVLG